MFAELPPSLERFERVVRAAPRVERLYFAYGDASLDPVFFHVPDRERFKLLYGVLLQKKVVYPRRDLEGLHRRTGMSKRMIAFILRVFAELGFLEGDGGRWSMVENPHKRSLEESKTYREQLERERYGTGWFIPRTGIYAPISPPSHPSISEWEERKNMDFKEKIRVIPDFPQPGVRFKDITTLLKDGKVFHAAIDTLVDRLREKEIDVIVGPEARGFVVGAPLAYAMGVGFVPVRKSGKLPAETRGGRVQPGIRKGSAGHSPGCHSAGTARARGG